MRLIMKNPKMTRIGKDSTVRDVHCETQRRVSWNEGDYGHFDISQPNVGRDYPKWEISSSNVTKPTYIKNVPKSTTWDTKDKRNIEDFLTEYETYCDASRYNGDDVKVRSFGSFLKDGASIAFAAWRGSRGERLLWKNLKEWAIKAWLKPHQHLLDVTSLGTMKWMNDQNLSRYAEDYKCKYLRFDYENSPRLGMMGMFFASLDESIWRKVWKRESLPTTMMKLLNVDATGATKKKFASSVARRVTSRGRDWKCRV